MKKRGWKARCCEEGNILKGSSRERLCNSVEPSSVREELEKIETVTETPGDDVRVGMSLKEAKPHQGTAFFQAQALSGHQDACDRATGVHTCKDEKAHKRFLELCEKPEEGWQFLAWAQHRALKRHAKSLEGTGVSTCKEKFNEDSVDSVSWFGADETCYFIKEPNGDVQTQIYDHVKKTVSELEGGVVGAALFMKKTKIKK